MSAQTLILDFENDGTSTSYGYFGSSLEGDFRQAPIANPDMSGINTSDSVMVHVKAANSQVWSGAFSDPLPATAIDLVNNNQVCMDVWLPEPGTVRLKLEQSTDGGGDWERDADNEVTEGMTWTQVCWNVALPSVGFGTEGNIPDGFTYAQPVVFFNFGTSYDTDQTFYWDNLIVQTAAAQSATVDFAVDMSEYAGSFTTVFVSGGFNGWSGNANPLNDDDGDNIWTASVPDIALGAIEYKFQVDEWSDSEQFNGTEVCTISSDGVNINRAASITGDMTMPTFCWESCYACGESVDITFNLGGAAAPDPGAGFFIAGGGNFGAPGDFELTDDDMDGIYSITVNRAVGFNSFYTFTNGACPDFSCKEDISGQSCANPANFNDRFLPAVTQDTTLSLCFGDCDTASGDCPSMPPPMVDITFEVGLPAGTDVSDDGLYIAGGAAFGFPGDFELTDDDMDGVYSITITRAEGFSSFFTITNGLDFAFKEDISGQDCADPNNFNDRFLPAVSQDTTLSLCFGNCAGNATDCGPTNTPMTMVTFQVDMSVFDGDFDTANIFGSFNGWDSSANPLNDDDGDDIYETTIEMMPGDYEYKFVLNGGGINEEFMDGDSCTVTDPSGQFVNRFVTIGTTDVTICKGWNTCLNCDQLTDTREPLLGDNLFSLRPALALDVTTVQFAAPTPVETIRVFTATGQLTQQINVGGMLTDYQLDLAALSAGVYLVTVQTENGVATRRLVRQ